jgi:ribonuclease HII
MVIVGIDEVGRGCWAGPLVVGAVILNQPIDGLRDSKKLTKKRRENLSKIVLDRAAATGLGWVTAEEIDSLGLTRSTGLATERALAQIKINFDEIIIDGNTNFLPEDPRARTIINADNCVAAVSAASIIAKVARDAYMTQAALLYPDYGFDVHVGYGTTRHIASLRKHGICQLHRRSYKPIRNLTKPDRASS